MNRDRRRDSGGTVSLKALAAKALGRDTTRDSAGTAAKIAVPLPETPAGHFFERVSPVPPSQNAPLWAPEDWFQYYEERAAIREYDGLLPRAEADRRAWRETANRYWHEHGSRSAPGICCGCGRPVSLAEAIPLPHGQSVHDADCMAAFGRRWLREAAEALAQFGIPTPPGYRPDEP